MSEEAAGAYWLNDSLQKIEILDGRSTSSKIIFESIGLVEDSIKELSDQDKIIKPRLLLFGSSANEVRQPHDIDLLLLYDSIKPFEHSMISSHASEFWERLNASQSAQIRIDFVASNNQTPLPAQGLEVTAMTTSDFMNFLHSPAHTNRLEALIVIENLYTEESSEIDDDLKNLLKGLSHVITYSHEGQASLYGYELSDGTVLASNDQANFEAFVKDYVQHISDQDLRTAMSEALLSEDNVNKKTNCNLLLKHISQSLSYSAKKRLMKSYHNYTTGTNWIQDMVAGKEMHLLYGENLIDNGTKLFIDNANDRKRE